MGPYPHTQKFKAAIEIIFLAGCRHFNESIGEKKYCLVCYAEMKLVPPDNNEPSTSEKRTILSSRYNMDGVNELTSQEVDEYFEIKDTIDAHRHNLGEPVPFPVHPSTDLKGPQPSWKKEIIAEVDLSEDGGSFISDPNIPSRHLPGILELLASLVKFESKKQTNWKVDLPIYRAMPQLFIDFSNKS